MGATSSGIDVSTTATKAVLVDEAGAVRRRSASPSTASSMPQPALERAGPGAVVGRARSPRSGRCSRDRASTAEDVDAIGLTGQMHGAVLLDAADEVLRPAILWNDQRTAAECDEIRAAVGPGAADRRSPATTR